MRVGYFGGTFDPPHRGHLAVATAARDAFGLDRLLLAPTGRQPLKTTGAQASFADRLAMTELLCAAGGPALEVSAVEAPHPDGTANYTVDTLSALRRDLPAEAELFAIVGADAFAGLPQWRGADRLLDLAEWIVVSRPGSSLAAVERLATGPEQLARIHRLDGLHDPASATELRSRLRAGLPCGDLLLPAVALYIQQHQLYGG